MTILHLTHTDILSDSRILKEIKVLSGNKDYFIYGLGVLSISGLVRESMKNENVNINSLKIYSKKLNFLPSLIKHPIVFLELMIKVLLKTSNLNFDVIHCHDTLVLPIGVLIKKIKKTKLIYDAHELESDRNGQNKIMSKGTFFLEKIMWKKIDHFISVSHSIINWYQKNLGNKKSTLILNSPELTSKEKILEKYSDNNKYFHKKYNISNKTKIFIYLGFLTKGRGIEETIRAFNYYKIKSHVVFIGYGELKYNVINSTKNNDRIHFHPPVKHNQVVNMCKSADYGLCLIENISLSDYYCLPNKLFEYAFSGLPVLASNFPELSKVVSNNNLGISCDPDSVSIRDSILKIEKKPLKKNSLNLYKLSWQYQGEKLLNVYKFLIK